ncbi:hypothetical protein FRUB_06262 [Fimbriiglobus ruber]|uniref:Uncharacterized protein n=1 Tax=Fimbriiglobus ruber TaxID=1908690 RepID=A0A225DC65_9BACT|nr:hypothetical protein FRUB_06262 [Fimbriiglobus ruber]
MRGPVSCGVANRIDAVYEICRGSWMTCAPELLLVLKTLLLLVELPNVDELPPTPPVPPPMRETLEPEVPVVVDRPKVVPVPDGNPPALPDVLLPYRAAPKPPGPSVGNAPARP